MRKWLSRQRGSTAGRPAAAATGIVCLCGSSVRFGGLRPDPAAWYLFDEPTRRKWHRVSPGAQQWRAAAANHCRSGRHLWVLWDGPGGRRTVYRVLHTGEDETDPDPRAPGLSAPDSVCSWQPVPITARPAEVDLPHWWAVQAALFRELPAEPGTALLRPLRRCPDGDHLVAWWDGEREPASVYVAVGVTRAGADAPR
ncbi:hypothetical protein FDO65_02335 [Nakamurella flava]|uniref:Uncharacterized protein n=1 Tax=Nakamurella flava TaxID=2576308 RepID=A0A4U6QJF8_9ACTN|nr:hypothetical protein [Nakamurella flava]TKV60563.1 hypothetical protein FDO65_02335 [Nakamurella flava]